MRIWRKHILMSPSQKLKQNFITHNAYTCIEINARCLINLVKKFREANTPELFLPTLFDSQTCESMFRQLRSMGTMNFTRINFSIYDLLHMVGRTEVQNSIVYFKLPEEVSFPLTHKRTQKTKIFPLPSDMEINSTLEEARKRAIEDALKFGMTNSQNIENYEIHSRLTPEAEGNGTNDELPFADDDGDIIDINNEIDDMTCENDEQMKEDFEPLDENSPLTAIVNEDGSSSIVRKSCLVWMLTEPGVGLSKDRLRRVQVTRKRKLPEQ